MKIILTIALVFLIQSINAQIDFPDALRQRLNGKIKFEEIKTTINQFYIQKLATLSITDTITSKAIMRQLKKWNRQFWLSEFYTNADGITQDKNKIDADAYSSLQNNGNATTNTSSRQNINWINHGPFNSNTGIGRIDKIAFHPTNPNIIYAGSPHGGLFYTTDGGNNWAPRSTNLPSLGISGIAINPNNPNLIYVLTGEANTAGYFGNDYLSSSQGVFKSTDGGNTWLQTGALANGVYRAAELVMDPTNSNILLAATSVGIYRTINGGISWTLTTADINFFDVKFQPGNGNIVYAANNEFYKSTDGGATFSTISIPSLAGANRISIGVTPANSSKVVLLAGPKLTNITFKGIFSSSDTGKIFSLMSQSPNVFSNTIGNAVYNDQSHYDNCIAISPTNQNEIYVGGLCVWKSINGGSNWNQVSAYWPSDNPYAHPDIHELIFNSLNGDLFCGNDGGVYKRNGANWDARYTGIATTQFYHFESEKNNNLAWGGTQDNGLISQIASAGVYQLSNFGDGYDVLTDHNYIVSGGASANHYASLNYLVTKNGANFSIPNNSNFFGNLALAPNNNDKLYVGYYQAVYIRNAAKITSPVGWDSIGTISGNWCISSCRNNANILYTAGTGIANQRLFNYNVSTNTTTNITPPVPYNINLKITDIDVDPLNANNIWISVGGTQANAKVFYSSNGGTTWQNYTFNLPNVPIFCIKKDVNYGLYVGTSIGIFYCKDVNSYWEPYSNGLPPAPVTEIELWPEPNPVNGNVPSYAPTIPEIWISTFGRGIWYTQQSTAVCESAVTLSAPVSGVYYKEVSNNINSSQSLIGGVGTNVKYNASQSILLTDGFFAPDGTRFQTFSSGCGNPINLNRKTPLKNTNDHNTDKKKSIPIK